MAAELRDQQALRAALRAGTVVQHKLAKASRDGGASKDHYGYSNAKDYAARTGWYNRLLGSPSFWRRFASEYVLIFELDAAFCDRPSAPVAKTKQLAGRPPIVAGAPRTVARRSCGQSQ